MPKQNKDEVQENKKFKNIVLIIFCTFVIGVFSAWIIRQASAYNDLRARHQVMYENLNQALAEYQDLQYQLAHFDSDAYVEQLARTRLGWLRPDQMVLRRVAE